MKSNIFKIFTKKTSPEPLKPLKENTDVRISFRLSSSSDSDEYVKVDTAETSQRQEYRMKYEYWRKETMAFSVMNTNNTHIRDISSNYSIYLPFIKEDLQNNNYDIISMLEVLYPEKITYSPMASVKQARRAWLKILQELI